MNRWKIEYDNGDRGGEWWNIVEEGDGRIVAACGREADAVRIILAINFMGDLYVTTHDHAVGE